MAQLHPHLSAAAQNSSASLSLVAWRCICPVTHGTGSSADSALLPFKASWSLEREKPLLLFLSQLCVCVALVCLHSEKKKKKSLKCLLTPAQTRETLCHELNVKQVLKGCPGMLSQIRPGQTSPEQGPFLLLMARATIMVIDASPACRSPVRFYDQKKYFSPFALSLCWDRRAVTLDAGSHCLPCPACWAVIPDGEFCFSLKEEKKKSQTKPEEWTHMACQVSLHVWVFSGGMC